MEPLADIICLLRPRAVGVKLIEGAGRWRVRYADVELAGFGLVLAGACELAVDGQAAVQLGPGDFVLMPPTPGFVMASDPGAPPVVFDAGTAATAAVGHVRHGDPEGTTAFQMLGGYFRCAAANACLLTGLLPGLVHVPSGEAKANRLGRTLDLIAEEAADDRPGRDLIVERLVEVMLVEALRLRVGDAARPGLLDALADPHLARALRRLHADVSAPWTVARLAREAGLSRSAFSDRFTRRVGAPPMEYLIGWRMARAKDMLQNGDPPLETVAAAIGYQSASAFSTAFRRQVGQPPSRFAREAAA